MSSSLLRTPSASSYHLPGEGLDATEAMEFAEVFSSLQLSPELLLPNVNEEVDDAMEPREFAEELSSLRLSPFPVSPDPSEELEDVSVADSEDYDADADAASSTPSVDGYNSEEAVESLFEGAVQWMLRFPTWVSYSTMISTRKLTNCPQASNFTFDNDSQNFLRVRLIVARIDLVEAHFLPHIIRVFANSLPFVSTHVFFDEEGLLELQHMNATLTALSSMEPSFWSANPVIRDIVIAAFPVLHVWIAAVSKMVVYDNYPVQGRKYEALYAVHSALWLIRDVGEVAFDFVRRQSLWDDALFVWSQSKGCSPREENLLAGIFSHAQALFLRENGGGFFSEGPSYVGGVSYGCSRDHPYIAHSSLSGVPSPFK